MVVMTARDYCVNALYDCGELAEGLDASPEQISRALRELNGVLRRWNAEGLTRFHIASNTVSVSASPITIGNGMMINISNRPRNIISVVMDGNELRQISMSEMSAYGSTVGRPYLFSYNAKTIIGEIHLFPYPDRPYSFTVNYEAMFRSYNLNDDVELPDEYSDLLRWMLADRIAKSFGSPRIDLQNEADRALRIVKSLNVDMRELSISQDIL